MIVIYTPDNWGPDKGDCSKVVAFRDGVQISLLEAIGTTPEETPVLNHIGVSGGKDSDALLAWALYESGYDIRSIIASFCDTGNEDFYTHEQIKFLRSLHPIHTVQPGKDFYELVRHKGMFPSRKRRFCTEFLKMEPARLFAHALVELGFKIVMHSGVRADESDDRSKLPETDFDSFFALPIYRPLLRKTIADVVDMHKKYGIPFNKLYSLGARRVGCFPCINSVKREMRLVADLRPEKIDAIERTEGELMEALNRTQKGGGTFFHRNTVPLRFRSLDYTTKQGKVIKIATIRDVVNWSRSGYRAKGRWDDQPELQGFKETSEDTCAMNYGACE